MEKIAPTQCRIASAKNAEVHFPLIPGSWSSEPNIFELHKNTILLFKSFPSKEMAMVVILILDASGDA